MLQLILSMKVHDPVIDRPLLILAGGFGTRLRSVVSEVPKPLAPVRQKPFLYYLVEQWMAQGVRSLTFLLHHEAERIEDFLDSEKREGILKECELRTLTEPQPLGTGGAVAFAVRQLALDGSFLIANADTWLESGIHQVWDTPQPALAVVRVENSERYGAVQIQQNKVFDFKEKQQSAGPAWINAGLYHLHADLFHDWNGRPFSLEQELFPRLVSEDSLRAVPLKTDFIDIGVPTDYFRFCRWIESGKRDTL